MKHKVIECNSIQQLNEEVNKLIGDSWFPLGTMIPVSVGNLTVNIKYTQTLTKVVAL